MTATRTRSFWSSLSSWETSSSIIACEKALRLLGRLNSISATPSSLAVTRRSASDVVVVVVVVSVAMVEDGIESARRRLVAAGRPEVYQSLRNGPSAASYKELPLLH